ncbi:NAD-dependent epimerase/dehydratase family protein [Reichenbachiella sp.]|uniref:NAD-dependent epimerase/dehydratase family protein n=1 Tax=Reichenbachiella sp. TaxID=2184521 RepID=UPI003BAF5375
MKIAIIGSNSFLAQSIRKHVSNHKLIGFARKSEWPFDYPSHGVESLNINLLLDFDLIIYCAGAGIQPNHSESEKTIEALNFEQPKQLINHLQRANFKGQLITFGSYFEIGNTDQKKPFTETELIASYNSLPNIYCKSKKKLTKHISEQLSKSSFNHLHLILTNIYGVGENESRLFPYLARSFKAGQEVSLTSGEQVRQFTHVDDVAKFILSSKSRSLNGILNFTNPESTSVRSVIETFAKLMDYPKEKLKFDTANRKDTSMEFLALNTSKLKHITPDFEFVTLEVGLTEYI